MTNQKEQDLEQVYGPMASHSEHHRGDFIRYTSAEGTPGVGVIEWVCSAGMVGPQHLGIRYIVAPDTPTGFVDVVWPADVISSEASTSQEPQERTMQACPYCFGMHYDVEACPLHPKNRE